MAEQTCKDCEGQGMWLVDMGDAVDGCRTCDGTGTIRRTGPYRLADGTWSDGEDRLERIRTQIPPNGRWLLDRNLELECPDCGRRFGSLKEPRTYTMITELKFKWHRWTGQCKNGETP